VKNHRYEVDVTWTGNQGAGTRTYTAYSRDHEVRAGGKPVLPCSSDPVFRGDGARYSPEDLLVASLSSCHMLWYLHLCAVNNIVVLDYRDHARGVMAEAEDSSGAFTEVVLQPQVIIARGSDVARALALHEDAHAYCFIANSVNFPVKHQAVITVAVG
jgi:organic hydroperoxide reductase OsmC/OhrA